MIETKSLEILSNLIESGSNLFFISWDENNNYSCSNSFEKLTGYTAEELDTLPQKHFSLIVDDSSLSVISVEMFGLIITQLIIISLPFNAEISIMGLWGGSKTRSGFPSIVK